MDNINENIGHGADNTASANDIAGDYRQIDAVKPDIPLGRFGISKWNRSYGLRPDKQYQDQLVESIRRNGLLHPVTLVRDPEDPELPFKIVAGANRVAALFLSRPDDQVLHANEYTLLDDGLTEANPLCLQISLAENQDRRESSPYERAVYVRRLVEQEGLAKRAVADAMHKDPSEISRLIKLAGLYDGLPASWQEDLRGVPGLETFQAPAITLGHFAVVATKLGDGKAVSGKTRDLMELAHAEQWSVARLDEEIKALKPANGLARPNGMPSDWRQPGGPESEDRAADDVSEYDDVGVTSVQPLRSAVMAAAPGAVDAIGEVLAILKQAQSVALHHDIDIGIVCQIGQVIKAVEVSMGLV